jgi:hypothetical protein
MYTYVLQDWTTIRGSGGTAGTPGASVVQNQDDWLDLSPFQDVFFWVDVRESLGTVLLYLDTSPTDDEALFQPLTGVGTAAIANLSGVISSTPTILKLPMLSATVPIARYLRWRLTSTSTPWDATFRIVVAANSPGM